MWPVWYHAWGALNLLTHIVSSAEGLALATCTADAGEQRMFGRALTVGQTLCYLYILSHESSQALCEVGDMMLVFQQEKPRPGDH